MSHTRQIRSSIPNSRRSRALASESESTLYTQLAALQLSKQRHEHILAAFIAQIAKAKEEIRNLNIEIERIEDTLKPRSRPKSDTKTSVRQHSKDDTFLLKY